MCHRPLHPARWPACLLTCLCACLTSTIAVAQHDPLIPITPEAPPAFRQVLKGEEYRRQLAQALEAIGSLDELRASRTPVAGLRLIRIIPDSQADRLGLEEGDVIVRFDSSPSNWLTDLPREEGRRQVMEYYDQSDNALRSAEIQPGLIGIYYEPNWRPEFQFLRSSAHDAKYEQEAIVGITARQSNPDLAETAWYHAVQKGCRGDHHAAASGAAIAMAQGRPHVAAEFAHFARPAEEEKDQFTSPILLVRVALANFQLETAKELSKSYPQVIPMSEEYLQQLIELHRGRPVEERIQPPPSKLAELMYRDDAIPRSVVYGTSNWAWPVDELLQGKAIEIEAPTARYATFNFGPVGPSNHLDYRFRSTIAPTDQERSNYVKVLLVGLNSRRSGQETEAIPPTSIRIGVVEENGSKVRLVVAGAIISYPAPQLQLDGNQMHEYRIVRANDQLEAFLNGKRVLYLPAGKGPAPHSFHFQAVGVTMQTDGVEAVELVPRR